MYLRTAQGAVSYGAEGGGTRRHVTTHSSVKKAMHTASIVFHTSTSFLWKAGSVSKQNVRHEMPINTMMKMAMQRACKHEDSKCIATHENTQAQRNEARERS